MNKKMKRLGACLAMAGFAFLGATSASAGECKSCLKKRSQGYVHHGGGPVYGAPAGHGPTAGHGPMSGQAMPVTPPIIPDIGPDPGPPEGTIGTTYKRSSRLLPDDFHPRDAVVRVKINSGLQLSADGMESYLSEDGYWYLETDDPLIPGTPNIIRIDAGPMGTKNFVSEYRFVRLIPGRIFDMTW